MISAVNFLIESGISLSLLAIIYLLFLRKETFFRLNRAFLLGSILFSVVLPFLRFRVYEAKSVMLPEVTVTPYKNLLESVTIHGQDFSGTVEHAILSANVFIMTYLAGFLFLFIRFIFRIAQLYILIRKNEIKTLEKYKLVLLTKNVSPFSFLNYVFVGKESGNQDGYDRMVLHEVEHIKQGHTFDIIILELLTIFQWFNPFMWMLRRAIRENHEYLADQAVLNSGISRGNYKKLLLTQFVGGQLVIANNFNYSLIKKRIKMMSKMKSSRLAISKVLIGIVVAVSLIIVFACEQKELIDTELIEPKDESEIMVKIMNEKLQVDADSAQLLALKKIFNQNSGFKFETDSLGNVFLLKEKIMQPKILNSDTKIFTIVEKMPEFPGGDSGRAEWLRQNINYPRMAMENGIQGKVFVSFIVTKDGDIANAYIARGVDPFLDQEALRVVNLMPKWKPGTQRGEPVNVSFTVPINFVLQ